ncbi:hypothetical protein [Clostridium sp. VAP41]|uniref:hypothetical protein n=1 Tax=Clostridium sp. VAP41 TaxID=2949979 RepID=UPI002079CFB9|nr:hypothetical protein [Clostridium sp. VAP41]
MAHVGELELLTDEGQLDKMDYHWFLITLAESLEKQSILHILDDRDGNSREYQVVDVEIDSNKLNSVNIKLKDIRTNEVSVNNYLVKEVRDARIVLPGRKYYVTTDKTKFRFTTTI